MKSPLAKLAVAAAAVVACVMGLFLWTGTQSSIALADVLARMREVRAYVFHCTATITGLKVGDKTVDTESHSIIMTSQDHGTKMVIETVDPNGARTMTQEMYMSPQNGTMLTIMPEEKRYMRMEYDEGMAERMRKQNHDPSAIVQLAIGQGYESLGRVMLDGTKVEKFRSTDPNFLGNVMDQPEVMIYVDVRTQLPVRMEIDARMGEGARIHTAMYDFQWDVVVDAAEFEPVIPADYTLLAGGPFKMPSFSEEIAIQGLKLFAELTGRYPEKLDMMTLMSVMKDLGKRSAADGNQSAKDRLDEHTKQFVETLVPITGIGSFYTSLSEDQKHPAYYGNVVTPEDADQVLMRWKVSGNEYRVIFGSLHVETVSAEALAELEKALPQQ